MLYTGNYCTPVVICSPVLYGNVNQSYFQMEKPRMFLIFLQDKQFLKISHFAYAIGTNHINLRQYLKSKIDHYSLLTLLVENIYV